jgi:hypothetical protein
MDKIIRGGFLAGHRTYIISGIGILSAIGGYMVGDTDIFGMLQIAFPLAGIYFLRRGMGKQTENKNGNTKKVSKRRRNAERRRGH